MSTQVRQATRTDTLADGVLRWMVGRLQQGTKLDHDLVLVRDHEVLVDASDQLQLDGAPWTVASAVGELSLRDVLPRGGGRVIVRIVRAFRLAPDVAGRAYLGRVLEVRADDVVAAITGRFAEPIVDEALSDAVFGSVDALRRFAGFQTLGNYVSVAEVRAALVAAQLGTDDAIDRRAPAELLRGWLLDGSPAVDSSEIFEAALREAHGRIGGLLARAVIDDSLDELVMAGALAGSLGAWSTVTQPAGFETEADRSALRSLVFDAVRDLIRDDPAAARRTLAGAEQRIAGAEWLVDEAPRLPLLEAPLRAALEQHARAAAAGDPAADEAIEALGANVHDASRAIALVREVSRLARALDLELPEASAPVEAWLLLARDHVGWVDLALRRARRLLAGDPMGLTPHLTPLIERVITWRDMVNERFATRLAADWQRLAGSKHVQAPLPVHQLGRALLRKLIDDEQRVFLVVLDACEFSTLYEMLEALQARRGAPFGLRLPDVSTGTLRDDLKIHAVHVAVAALPTVTNHSRRALFAGELPGNSALDETEASASNASADKTAFERNKTFDGVRRSLFLKGDLADGGQALRDTLEHGDEQLVAVVFNAIDDALSSKETTPFDPWTFEGLGSGAMEALATAVEHRWTVVLTADHGHTPFVEAVRKVAARGLATRYHDAPRDNHTIAFERGPLPSEPLHLLYELGAWQGTQRRGFHGGAGLEEVAVPLAFFGPRDSKEEHLRPPRWWWTQLDAEPTPEAAAPVPPPAQEPEVEVELELEQAPGPQRVLAFGAPPWLREIEDAGARKIFAHLAEHRSITEEEARRMLGGSARKLRRFDNKLQVYLSHVPFKVRVESTGSGKRYVKDE